MHRKSALIISFFLFVISLAPFQRAYSQHWTQGIKANGSQQGWGASDIAVDGKGNIVIAGDYKNLLSFGDKFISTDDSYSDLFLCRIGADRNAQWLIHIEAGFNNGEEIGMSTDDDSNIYLTGSLDGYIFVSKYDSSGNLRWTQNFEEKFYGYGTTVKTDMFDNVYVVGGSGWTFFAAKVAASGSVVWKKEIWVNYSDGCNITDMDVDASGNVYFAGTFNIDLPLDNIMLKHSGNHANVFWGQMDNKGNFKWVKSSTGMAGDHVSMALTADGNIFLAGAAGGLGVTFDNYTITSQHCCSGATPFLVKSDGKGVVQWAKLATDNYYGNHPVDLQADHNDNLYLTGGYFTCYGSFCTEADFYFEKYDKDGTPIWRSDYASTLNDNATAIDVDNNGSVYVLGVDDSQTFIDPSTSSPTSTFGVGIFDSGSGTYKKTARPTGNGLVIRCADTDNSKSTPVTVKGQNIQWYRDAALTKKIGTGNTFQVSTVTSDTVYVTQTVNAVESWPKPVIIRVISFPGTKMIVKDDSIHAPLQDGVSYQWLYDNNPIQDATASFVEVDTTHQYDRFSVVLSDATCQKTITDMEIITGVEDDANLAGLKAYPNPTSSFVSISLGAGIPSQVEVNDVLGHRTNASILVSASEVRIDLTNEKPGLYMVQLLLNNKRRFLKVVKG